MVWTLVPYNGQAIDIMLTLPMFPYYTNSHSHWIDQVLEHRNTWQPRDYKAWILTQHVAHMATTNLHEFYSFETEQDRMWFALRWS